MPELPEVETIVRQLNKYVAGCTITDVWTDNYKNQAGLTWAKFRSNLTNKKIIAVERQGKNILIYLTQDRVLWIHLKLTGHLLLGKYIWKNRQWQPLDKGAYLDPQNRFIHWVFNLNNKKQLVLADTRKFAKVILLPTHKIKQEKGLQDLGRDPLTPDFTEADLRQLLSKPKSDIKKVLMDQTYLSGIGNIYANEILFQARINPFKKANQLTGADIHNLFLAIRSVLIKAIKYQGTSAEDEAYRMLNGAPGSFAKFLQVYQKEGQKCPRCSAIIKRVVSQNRSTFYCPKCQKI